MIRCALLHQLPTCLWVSLLVFCLPINSKACYWILKPSYVWRFRGAKIDFIERMPRSFNDIDKYYLDCSSCIYIIFRSFRAFGLFVLGYLEIVWWGIWTFCSTLTCLQESESNTWRVVMWYILFIFVVRS